MALHEFRPSIYYVAIGTHPAALTIESGDTVRTSTVDSGGRDQTDTQVTEPGNPMTGPFSVRGAEPGDTLAVHLDKLRPNRVLGRTGVAVAENCVDPDYVAKLPASRPLADWNVDVERWTATLVSPETALGRLTLPLDPMIGCFGVAPPRYQAISTATSSTHGGNMDYRGFREGVTVYFPVFVPGALFQIGDGHAIQGDGEIVGTGIEISFDVEFTCRVIKGKKINWPLAENDEYIMTVGNARPLDQALQHATTEMLLCLQEDYHLDAAAANILLGQCVQYDLGNIYDPAYTMVCKVSKKLLSRL